MASRVMAFTGRPTNPARPYPEMSTWKAAVFHAIGDVNPAIHLRSILLRVRDIEPNPRLICSSCDKSMRCDVTPIICSSCQRHYHIICCRLTRTQNGIQVFDCLFYSGGAASIPPTTTFTGTSVLPRRCLLCPTKIQFDICPIMFQQGPTSHTWSALASPDM